VLRKVKGIKASMSIMIGFQDKCIIFHERNDNSRERNMFDGEETESLTLEKYMNSTKIHTYIVHTYIHTYTYTYIPMTSSEMYESVTSLAERSPRAMRLHVSRMTCRSLKGKSRRRNSRRSE
jgi:hypothetical protein